jgi:hypothetical protein
MKEKVTAILFYLGAALIGALAAQVVMLLIGRV